MANVNVTYEEMRAAGKRLGAGRGEIETKLAELQKLVQSLVNGGYVTDQSSKQFEQAYERFNVNAKGIIGSLEDMDQYLTKAADAFEQADRSLSNSLPKG